MLQPPIYHQNYPIVLNFGGLLPIIAHELVHGFDTIGGLYDRSGNYQNWWTQQSKKQFMFKSYCFLEQYNKLVEPMTGFKV